MALDKLDVTMLEDVGTSANQLVQLDGSAKLPALDGSNLTNLNTAELTGGFPAADASAFTNLTAENLNGTIPDAVFPTILPARNAQALTNLNAANISGTLPSTINLGGVGSAITALTAGNIVGTMPSIDGNNLTNLNASNLGTGTIPTAVIPDPLPQLNGAALTNVPALLVGDGSLLTLLNGSAIATGTVDSARLDTGVTAGNVIMVEAHAVGGGDTLPAIDGSQLTGVQASLTGDGSGLTLLNAAELSGTCGVMNGAAITDIDGGNITTALAAVDGSALTNLTATNLSGSIPLSNLVVKQVLSHTKVDQFDTNSDIFVDVPDMEISITTTQLNSRIVIFGHLALSATSNYSWGGWHVRLTRDGTVLKVGTDTSGAGNDEQGAIGGLTRSDPLHATHPAPFQEVDEPGVAASTTLVYKVQVAATHMFTGGLCRVYVNMSATPHASVSGTGVSTITIMEVAA